MDVNEGSNVDSPLYDDCTDHDNESSRSVGEVTPVPFPVWFISIYTAVYERVVIFTICISIYFSLYI